MTKEMQPYIISVFLGLVCFGFLPLLLNSQAPAPHLGDIRLVPCTNAPHCTPSEDTVIGALNINFYKNRDMNDELVFKPVCSDDFTKKFDEAGKNIGATAICMMLDYEVGEISDYQIGFPKYPVGSYAIKSVDCTIGNPSHILRCAYNESTQCSYGTLHLQCSGRRITKDKLFPSEAVDGTVQLCPPDQTLNSPDYPNVQISMGLVSVAHENYYGAINEQPNTVRFGTYKANSICQQLGFTGSVSESSRTVGSYDGRFTFYNCFKYNHILRIWLTTEVANKCDHFSCPCFSHCYDFLKEECSPETCKQENNLVIECTFDVSEVPPPAGTNDPHVQCTDQCGLSDSLKVGALVFLLLALIIAITVFSIVIIFLCRKIQKLKRRLQYENIPGINNLGAENQNVNNDEEQQQ